jgi:hypothetical protein
MPWHDAAFLGLAASYFAAVKYNSSSQRKVEYSSEGLYKSWIPGNSYFECDCSCNLTIYTENYTCLIAMPRFACTTLKEDPAVDAI